VTLGGLPLAFCLPIKHFSSKTLVLAPINQLRNIRYTAFATDVKFLPKEEAGKIQ
jgi:hypothetical protein